MDTLTLLIYKPLLLKWTTVAVIRQGFCLPLYEQVFGIWCIWYLVYLAFGIKYEDYLNSLPNIYL